jgi:Pyruvate/2-oxoacid:ferredoxin oxidoreductase gamma subunit
LILINSSKEINSFGNLKRFKIGLVDAGLIARRAGLGDTFNTAILGAYVRLAHLVRMDTLIDAVRAMVPARMEENVQAVREAYEQTKVYEIGR